jgi:hypothetical protein
MSGVAVSTTENLGALWSYRHGFTVVVILVFGSFAAWFFRGDAFSTSRPRGLESSSFLLFLTYAFSWTSQFAPASALANVFRNSCVKWAIWPLLDVYVLVWLGLASFSLVSPSHFELLSPLFVLRLWEYISIILYQTLFRGLPIRDDAGYRFGARSLVVGVLNFVAFAIIFAAVYRAYSDSFDPPLTSAREALYFSVVTMTTLGYGDITPCGSMQWVAMAQVFLGLFIVVILFGTFIGAQPFSNEPGNVAREGGESGGPGRPG